MFFNINIVHSISPQGIVVKVCEAAVAGSCGSLDGMMEEFEATMHHCNKLVAWADTPDLQRSKLDVMQGCTNLATKGRTLDILQSLPLEDMRDPSKVSTTFELMPNLLEVSAAFNAIWVA